MNQTSLSLCQESDYRVYLSDPMSTAYNTGFALLLKGELNIEWLQKALNHVMNHNDALTMSFGLQDDKAVATYHHDLDLPITILNLEARPMRGELLHLENIFKTYIAIPFDLSVPPLLRAYVIRLPQGQQVFFVIFHHIIIDAWSVNLFMQKLADQYNYLSRGEKFSLVGSHYRYVDYVDWQQTQLAGSGRANIIAFWEKQFTPLPAVLELPTDYPRTAKPAEVATVKISVPVDLFATIKTFSQQQRMTIFCFLLSAFQIFLNHYSQQKAIVIGVPFGGRDQHDMLDTIGFFINDIPLVARLHDGMTFINLFNINNKLIREVLRYQNLPMSDLISKLKIPIAADGSQNLFRVMFNYINFSSLPNSLNFAGLTSEMIWSESGQPDYDLFLDVNSHVDGFNMTMKYNANLFKHVTIQNMMEKFIEILKEMVRSPNMLINE